MTYYQPSIGIEENRLDGTQLTVALFTNFTRDHLDYHGSMDAYWAAKRELFDWPGLRAAVLNLDDPFGMHLATSSKAKAAMAGARAFHTFCQAASGSSTTGRPPCRYGAGSQ